MHQGGVRLCRAVLLGIISAGFFSWAFCVHAIEPGSLVISKIQITGGTGKTAEDYVAVYNTTTNPIDLKGIRLVKRTKTGTTDTILKSWSETTMVNPGENYVWACSTDGFANVIKANTSSTQTISNDNGVAIREGANGPLIDSVGWGDAANSFAETTPFPYNPEGGQWIERNNNIDTNDNSLDFSLLPIIPDEEETETTVVSETDKYSYSKDIIISEIFANPKGIDGDSSDREFVELYNKGKEYVSLEAWRLEVDGISLELPLGAAIGGQSYYVIKTEGKVPLSNDGTSVKLYQPLKQTSYQSISYKKTTPGQSYANFITGGWQWTSRPTPGMENTLQRPPQTSFELLNEPILNQPVSFDSSDSYTSGLVVLYNWDFGDGFTSVEKNPTHVYTKADTYKINLTITTDYGSSSFLKTITFKKLSDAKVPDDKEVEVKEEEKPKTESKEKTPAVLEENKEFTTSGIATLTPGIFGVQYFYLLPEYGEPLIQIYNSKKLFPKIQAGDQVIVTGKYSETENGPKLSTKDANDIQIIGHAEFDEFAQSNSLDIKKPPYPRLAQLSGEVVSKKSPRVYLADAQGEIEIYLSKNTGLKISDFTVGDNVLIKGILTISNGHVRLQPRSKDDLQAAQEIKNSIESAELAQESTEITHTNLPEDISKPIEKSKKNILFIYLLAAALLMISGIILYVYKKK